MRYWKIILALALILLLPVAIEIRGDLGISDRSYSILVAPPLEEAFKGALLWIGITLPLWRRPRTRRHKPPRRSKYPWFWSGYLVGVIFGICEDFPSIAGMGATFASHAPWTAAVGTGIYFARAGRVSRLILSYLTVALAHGAWNYGVLHASVAVFSVNLVLTLAALGYVLTRNKIV